MPGIDADRRRPVFAVALVAGVLLFLTAFSQMADFHRTQQGMIERAHEQARAGTRDACTRLDEQFSRLAEIADRHALMLGRGRYSRSEIEAMIESVMKTNPEVFGFVIAFKPYAHASGTRLYAPYLDRKDGVLRRMQVGELYDYTREDTSGLNWYVKPMRNGHGWSEPFFGSASSDLLAVYSAPFTAPGDTGYSGVISIVYSLDDVRRIMDGLHLDSRGFGYLASATGTFLSHPNADYVKYQAGMTDLCRRKGLDDGLIATLLAGSGKLVEYRNEITGRRSCVLTLKVPATGYLLGTVYDHDLMLMDKDYSRKEMVRISLSLVLGLFCLALCTVLLRGAGVSVWSISSLLTVLLVLEIGFIWFLAVEYTPYSRPGSQMILDRGTLQSFLDSQTNKSTRYHDEQLITIPTGLFLQSLEFDNANNVIVTGYVWQRYASHVPADIKRGFILPEAISFSKEEAYRRPHKGGETIGWYFETTLRQEFDYSKYPLDHKDVWLRLWHADFDRNIVLVPDLDAYQLTDPKFLPGVEHDIVLSGWDIRQSFFNYVHNSYNTNFGISDYSGQEGFPELYFTVIISREFINPFVANLLPFLVMSLILFGTVMLVHQHEDLTSRFDSTITATLGACAGLFFSVLIAHTELRSSTAASGILYLEYFYFVMYGAIVVVAMNAFRVAFGSRSSLITYRDNIITKLVYWPALLSVLLMITVRTFY